MRTWFPSLTRAPRCPPCTRKQTKSEKQRKWRRKWTNLRWCSSTLARVVVAPAAFIFNAILRGSTFLPFRSGCTFSLLSSHSMRLSYSLIATLSTSLRSPSLLAFSAKQQSTLLYAQITEESTRATSSLSRPWSCDILLSRALFFLSTAFKTARRKTAWNEHGKYKIWSNNEEGNRDFFLFCLFFILYNDRHRYHHHRSVLASVEDGKSRWKRFPIKLSPSLSGRRTKHFENRGVAALETERNLWSIGHCVCVCVCVCVCLAGHTNR